MTHSPIHLVNILSPDKLDDVRRGKPNTTMFYTIFVMAVDKNNTSKFHKSVMNVTPTCLVESG